MEEYTEYYVSQLWECNARTWIDLNSAGYNVWRDKFNTPKFISILPPIEELTGVDIGCGDGYNTMQLSKNKPKKLIGIDVSMTMIEHAQHHKFSDPYCRIDYKCASVFSMPFANNQLDFAVALFTMMNIPYAERALKEVYRVLKPGGFFQFSITHPCFWTQRIEWAEDKKGVITRNYHSQAKPIFAKWTFEGVPENESSQLTTILYRKTFAEWINSMIEAGFHIEHLEELIVPTALVDRHPAMEGYNKLPFFAVFRARKLP